MFPGAPVVLVSIDTLRSDRLPAYGYASGATPHLDRLRREALLFESAWSPCPMTLPSHVTMLTGLLPPEHGVRTNVGFRFDAAAHASLPRLLKARGYATGAAVSSFVLRGESGLRAAFDDYEDSLDPRQGTRFDDQQRPGAVTLRFAREWLTAHAGGPFFYFFHLYEPHAPYDPPEPHRSRFAHPYDGEVAAADEVVGGLLDHLRALGLYDRALVIVTSDHGEGLGDHGEDQHSILLYREALQVPLLVKLPGGRFGGESVPGLAQLSDLLPTVTALLGLETPAGLRGRSLLELRGSAPPGRVAYGETLYPRLQLGWSELLSAVDGRWHYIHGPRPELYDLAADPRETRDLAAAQPRELARLRAEIEAVPNGPEAPQGVSPEEAERLAALGYVGTARARPAGAGLPNPREQLPSLERLREAYRLAAARRPERAADVLARLTRENPSLVEAWVKLGDVQLEAGRPAEAVSSYEEALRRTPVLLPDVALALGLAQLRAGRLAEADAQAARVEEQLPQRAAELRARVALARGQGTEAERLARSAIGPHPSSRLLLAEVLAQGGRLPAALAELEEAERQARSRELPGLRGLAFQRADALARLGRPAEAEAAYRSEIAAFPDQLLAWANLAALLYAQGRRAEVEPLLQAMAEANPTPRAADVAAATWSAFGQKARAEQWRRKAAALR